ncbi:protoporphyrinogen oxidase [Nocardioides sp. ChNu-99]|uniref:protoporphyrinogen oxidase n=1 Tax=Nocardioides sp. ChNu-99 TaxID=2839897 RepID=UPI0024051D63|nr:protoporphyrinogen oxidase [Nocardioides sp. ChNu-99]MDF9717169.1 protoporphyrinogen oxidase [Nocardioides sp. ChNu-99]
MARVVVVGAGVAGLVAAWSLARSGHAVTVLEADDVVGGKLRTARVAGVSVDVGAEAMLNRRPEGVALAGALGLPVTHPALVSSRVWTRGALRPLPRSLMGVPLDLPGLEASGVLSDEGLARVRAEVDLPAEAVETGEDITVGDLVDRRLGHEVTDRLVEPLLGGVYAGDARRISARAAVPQLVALAGRGSLLEQAAGLPTTYDAPVFAGITGGMGRLPLALAAAVRDAGGVVREGTPVRGLRRTEPEGTSGRAPTVLLDEEDVEADAVVLAVPAPVAALLLRDVAPRAATDLEAVATASVAVLTFAFRAADLPPLNASGFLVPPVEGRRIKASTFSSDKWAWVADAGRGAGPAGEDLRFLRTSVGRAGDDEAARPDADLVADSLAELGAALGLSAAPVARHVQRWPDGLPQYGLGHLDRVRRVRAAVAAVPGLAVAGATYDGVGIPAVVASAHAAVAALDLGAVAAPRSAPEPDPRSGARSGGAEWGP